MQVSEHDMLRLDDEMAGLIEAADASAGQDETHSMKPVATSSVPGELAGAHVMSAAALAGLRINWSITGQNNVRSEHAA